MPISAGDLATVATLPRDHLRNKPIDQVGYNHPTLELMSKRKKLNPGVNQKVQVRKATARTSPGPGRSCTHLQQARFSRPGHLRVVHGRRRPVPALGSAVRGRRLRRSRSGLQRQAGADGQREGRGHQHDQRADGNPSTSASKEKLNLEIHRDGSSGHRRTGGPGRADQPHAHHRHRRRPGRKHQDLLAQLFSGAVSKANLVLTMEAMGARA